MEQQSFGNWLRLKRKGLDLTREELGKQAGYSAATIRKIEAEERRPSEQIAERLADIFNIPKNERTDFLRFARGDWKSAPLETDKDQPWRASAKSPRSNIPATTTSLIGREKEIAEVREHLSQDHIRLVTLIGPPGIGKTRLSIEAARTVMPDFPDGVFFVPLAALTDPSQIASAVIQVLGYLESVRLPGREVLIQGIQDKQMLIVLDNCEHLIEEAASLASFLLSACPRLKILATSRESFRIPGEWLYPIPAFDLPNETDSIVLDNASDYPALMLFVERARAVKPDFKLTTENIQTIVAICSRLDGLPLVIELIAARMRLMSPQVLLERLSSQFVLTADGMRAASEHQKTLQNAIDWGYKLLSADEQKLFMYLSVFSGGFALADAETIFTKDFTEKSVTELVAFLLDKSLLRRTANQSNIDRYQMLVTIQEYALNRLKQSGTENEIRNRHLAYFSELARQASPHLKSSKQLEWLDRLDTEYDNIRAALSWAHATGAIVEGLRLVTDLESFWTWRVYIQEPSTALENLLTQALPADQIQALAKAHRLVGVLKWNSSNKKTSEAHFRESERLALLLESEDQVDLAWAMHVYRAFTQTTIVETPLQIRQRYDEFFKLFQTASHPWDTATMLSDMSRELARTGDLIGSRQALEHSLKLFQECGDRISASKANTILAYLAVEQGNYADARPRLDEILHFYRQARLNYLMDMPLWLLGVVAICEGDYTHAKEWYTECLLFDQQIGLPRQVAECFIGFAGIATAQQNFERAAQLLSLGKANAEARANPLETIDQIEITRLTAILRKELGDEKFEALVTKGRAMTIDQAISYALEDNL